MQVRIEAIAALIWRFAGLFLILSALPGLFATPFGLGAAALPSVLMTTTVMAVGTAFIVFSRPLGVYIATGLL